MDIERDLDDKVNASHGQGPARILPAGADARHQRGAWATPRTPAPRPIPTAGRVAALNLDDESTEKLLKECDRLARMQASTAESGVIRSYLDACLALPWHTATEDDLDQAHARQGAGPRALRPAEGQGAHPRAAGRAQAEPRTSRARSSASSALRASARPASPTPLPTAWAASSPA